MGQEASFQAIPEDCELMIAARRDREIAEIMQFVNWYATNEKLRRRYENAPDTKEFIHKLEKLLRDKPDFVHRYFYAGGRTYDAIDYLLSPARRGEVEPENDSSLIHEIIYGQERLHPDAIATQGRPIGCVSAKSVPMYTDYLNQITKDLLHQHYDVSKMTWVYKIYDTDGEERFEVIWEEFVGMREVYRAALEHNEAVITVID
jgi:hypothetical protein